MPKKVVTNQMRTKLLDMMKMDIPVSEISEKLGISTALIYYHTKKKPSVDASKVVLRKSNEVLEAENKQLKIINKKLHTKYNSLLDDIERVLDDYDD